MQSPLVDQKADMLQAPGFTYAAVQTTLCRSRFQNPDVPHDHDMHFYLVDHTWRNSEVQRSIPPSELIVVTPDLLQTADEVTGNCLVCGEPFSEEFRAVQPMNLTGNLA